MSYTHDVSTSGSSQALGLGFPQSSPRSPSQSTSTPGIPGIPTWPSDAIGVRVCSSMSCAPHPQQPTPRLWLLGLDPHFTDHRTPWLPYFLKVPWNPVPLPSPPLRVSPPFLPQLWGSPNPDGPWACPLHHVTKVLCNPAPSPDPPRGDFRGGLCSVQASRHPCPPQGAGPRHK